MQKRLWVGNLPFSARKEEIYQHFASNDVPVADVFIMRDRESNRSRGMAIVTVDTSDVDQVRERRVAAALLPPHSAISLQRGPA